MSSNLPEITKQVRMKGSSNLFDDAVTVEIGMKDDKSPVKGNKKRDTKALTHGVIDHVETKGDTTSLILGTPDNENPETVEQRQMEVKITFNMKQLEKHSRDIDKYVSPFPIQNTTYARVPLQPEDHNRIDVARDQLEELAAACKTMNSTFLSHNDLKALFSRLRHLDIRCSALYPRLPPPGSKEKRINRICAQFPLEIEDIEAELELIRNTMDAAAFFPSEKLFRRHVAGLEKERELDRENLMRNPEDRIPVQKVSAEEARQEQLEEFQMRRSNHYERLMVRAMKKHKQGACKCNPNDNKVDCMRTLVARRKRSMYPNQLHQ